MTPDPSETPDPNPAYIRLLSDGSILQTPSAGLDRIDSVYVFLSLDAEGREGLCAIAVPGLGGSFPLIASDTQRLSHLLPLAQKFSKAAGMSVRLVKLTAREEILVIDPSMIGPQS